MTINAFVDRFLWFFYLYFVAKNVIICHLILNVFFFIYIIL